MTAFINNDESQGRVYGYDYGFQRIRNNKAVRKDQHCLHGDHIILKGFPSIYYSGLYDGKLYHYHICAKCHEEALK